MDGSAGAPQIDTQFISALNEAADVMNDAPDVAATLAAIVSEAQRTLPGIEEVGISIVHRSGQVETMASTGVLVEQLDEIQYTLGQGPCVTAMLEDRTVMVEDARHEQRWPDFIREAVRLGLRAQLGVRLFHDDSGIGALNMYSFEADTLDPHLPHLAELFAGHAAHALGHARHSEQLETALETRSLIGQALGIVMERYQVDEPRAFDFLVRISSTSNTKLREVARRIVDDLNAKVSTGAPRQVVEAPPPAHD